MKPGVIALLGSGETAPSMTKVHRQLFDRLGEVRAVALDTSYAFQANVPQMTAKIVDYFGVSLQQDIRPVHLGDVTTTSPVEQAAVRQEIRNANYVFAGPGSPSYALRQWSVAGVGGELSTVVRSGGIVSFASAAALTLGAFTAPIYEIYKAGATPYWLEGLDLLSLAGLRCAVIPHYDNAEGGNYDTRFCYMGEERLSEMERQLPADVGILGIDEHTAVIIDLDRAELAVVGRANAYWRQSGRTTTLENGCVIPLSHISNLAGPSELPAIEFSPTVSTEIERLVSAASLGGPTGMEAIAGLAKIAATAEEISGKASTLIDELLKVRNEARDHKDFALADRIRDILTIGSVEVTDEARVSRWNFRIE